MFERELINNAGRFVGRHALVWIRMLDIPVETVWAAVSTKQGLDQWWIAPVEIDLRPGGVFSHHWENTVTDLEEMEFIDFGDDHFANGTMRFELTAAGDGTVFSFLDVWEDDVVPGESMLPGDAGGMDNVQPGGPGTPWSGVAAGWHGSIDALETYLTARVFGYTYEDLCRFYVGYLTDHFRRLDLIQANRERGKQ